MKKPKPCITVIKHSRHLRTLEKCRNGALVFYISLEFSNARRVLLNSTHVKYSHEVLLTFSRMLGFLIPGSPLEMKYRTVQ